VRDDLDRDPVAGVGVVDVPGEQAAEVGQVVVGRPEDAAASWQRAVALFDGLRDPQATSLRSRLSSLAQKPA
jgi:hypothetical protein